MSRGTYLAARNSISMTAFPNVHHACAAPWRPKYTWDPDEPRLTRVQGPGGIDVSYSYDSAGRMLTRVSGGVTTTLIWDGWTCVKEITGSSVTRYIAPQGEIHSFERDGQVYQVHADGHNGSVRAITDASGAVVAHYELDAWGAQLGSSSPFSGGFSFGFVGSLGVRTDATTGLLYMRHRWFDPNGLQRFLSRDVLGSLNRYEYCYNNPVNWVDLDGLDPRSLVIGIKQADIDDINWEFGLSVTTKAITHQELQATLKSDLQGVDVFVEPHYRGPSDPMLTQDVFYINVHLGEFQALQNRRRGARPRVLPHDANASLTHRQIIYKTDCERVAIEVSNEVQAIRNRWKVNIPMVGPRQHPMTPKLDIQALQHDAALRMLEGRIVEGTGLKNPFGGKSGYQLAPCAKMG